MSFVRPAFVLLILFTLLLGLAYPAAITGIAQLAFPAEANGGLIERDGKVVGSRLIGQGFSRPEYFWPRPSAAGGGYDASASSGSNYGPTSKALVERVEGDVARLHQGGVVGVVPADLATASGSGLDPHISPEAAQAQLARVAAARGMSVEAVGALVEAHTERPFLGVLGESGVKVLTLNLALDQVAPSAAPTDVAPAEAAPTQN